MTASADTPTPQPIRTIIVEDREHDAELMLHELRKTLLNVQATRVDTETDFLAQLRAGADLILSDYRLPQFNGLRALELLKSSGLDVPFIVVSGSIGEDLAVEAMKKGADDYLLKDRLTKLGEAVRHALNEKAMRERLRTASEELRRSEEKYRGLFESGIIGIFRNTPEGDIVEVNPALARMLGYDSPESLRQAHAGDLFPDPSDRVPLAGELAATGWIANREVRLTKKDGSRFIGLLTAYTCRDEQGRVRWVDGVLLDVTEQAGMQAETRRLKMQIEFLLGVTKTGLDIIDGDLNIRYIDPEWQKVYGPPAGQKCYVYFMGRQTPCPECGVLKALQTRQVAVTEEVLLREHSRPIQVTTIPFQDEKGEWLAAEVNVDLTERKNMEAQLRQAQKMESIGRLAAGIAHEINTPIQFLGDNFRFLRDTVDTLWPLVGALPDLLRQLREKGGDAGDLTRMEAILARADLPFCLREVPLALDQSMEGIQRITRIVRAMKEFSHPAMDEMVLVDVNKAIETTIVVARNEWKYSAELQTDLAPDLPPVKGLPGEINQVLLNLIVNAAHAIGDRYAGSGQLGLIRLSTRPAEDAVEIRVSDNGTGIAEEHRPHIFELFFTTKGVGQGTGQGLAMAYNTIVKKHAGSIAFETEPGKGTTFIVRLPLSAKLRPQAHNEVSDP